MWSELEPVEGQKSFYGKARIYHSNRYVSLYSYDTEILTLDKDEDYKVVTFIKDEWAYSRTTMRHVNSFMLKYGLNKTNIAKVRLSIENGEWYDV